MSSRPTPEREHEAPSPTRTFGTGAGPAPLQPGPAGHEDGEASLQALLAQVGDLGPAECLTALRADQADRWRGRQRVLVESYLQLLPALRDATEAILELIYAEVVLREEGGETPQEEEYLRRFPEHEAALRRQFALHAALQADTERGVGGGGGC